MNSLQNKSESRRFEHGNRSGHHNTEPKTWRYV